MLSSLCLSRARALSLLGYRGRRPTFPHSVPTNANTVVGVHGVFAAVTALFIAAGTNQIAVIKHLVEERRANPNLGKPMGPDPVREKLDGASPMLVAARAGHVDVVTYLMEANADPDLAMAAGVSLRSWPPATATWIYTTHRRYR